MLAVVVDLSLEGVNAWVVFALSLLSIAVIVWQFGNAVHRCFDGVRQELGHLRDTVDDIRAEMRHEAEMQKYRHQTNQAALAESREKMALMDADLTRARMDIAANIALIKKLTDS